MKPRLLLVCQHYAPEAFRSTDIAEYFVEQGCEVDVLCGLPNYPRGVFHDGYSYNGPYYEELNGVRIFRAFEIRRKDDTTLRIVANFMSFPIFAAMRVRRLLRQNSYNAVFCFQLSPVYMTYPALMAAKRLRIPCTTYVMDIWPDNLYSVVNVPGKLVRRLLQWTSDRIYARTDRLIALTPAMQGVLAKRTGKQESEIAVIPQFCEDFYADRPEPTDEVRTLFTADTFNIFYAGNMSPAQGLDNMVKAAALVEESHPGAVKWVIAGDGMSRAGVEELCRSLGVAHRFEFVGSVPPTIVPQFTQLADALFAGFSGHEALDLTIPGKYASYCAAGKPLLIAMGGESARVTREHECGLVSSPDAPTELAQNVLALMHLSAEERARMGNSCSSLYRDSFVRSDSLRRIQSFTLKS